MEPLLITFFFCFCLLTTKKWTIATIQKGGMGVNFFLKKNNINRYIWFKAGYEMASCYSASCLLSMEEKINWEGKCIRMPFPLTFDEDVDKLGGWSIDAEEGTFSLRLQISKYKVRLDVVLSCPLKCTKPRWSITYFPITIIGKSMKGNISLLMQDFSIGGLYMVHRTWVPSSLEDA